MKPKVITGQSEYENSLTELDRLMGSNPSPGSDSHDKILVLATLISAYEAQKYSFELPGAIEAIKFRMEEQGLKQSDLIPFIGSKSKVSEVLSEKRPLSLPMIRALHEGLGISAEVLLQEKQNKSEEKDINYSLFPFKELIKRGWIKETAKSFESAVENFIHPLISNYSQPIFWRRKEEETEIEQKKFYSLMAWAAVVLASANRMKNMPPFERSIMTKSFLKEIARLSYFQNGPLLAKEYLQKNGIILIIEPTFPSAKIDGATLFSENDNPIVALTLRYDRLDYFWFTLLHELAHVMKHLKKKTDLFIDDFEENDKETDFELKEKEADFIAKEAFVPRDVWSRSDAMRFRTIESIIKLSDEYRIHPSIVAGRIQRETNNYTKLRELLGEGKVRVLFQKD